MVKAELGGVTIANGASLSSAADLSSLQLVGIVMPAAWTAADITFEVSPDGITYYPLWDTGNNLVTVITPSAATIIGLGSDISCIVEAFRWVKLRSSTTGTPTNQGAARTLGLITQQRTGF